MVKSLFAKVQSLVLFLMLFMFFSPSFVAAKETSHADPWISLEKSLLQLYKQYSPNAPLLNASPFTEKVQAYLDAGLWSSAEGLLSNTPTPSPPDIEQLWLNLYLKKDKYHEIYEAYERDQTLFQGHPELILGAIQGALSDRDYQTALHLLNQLHFSGHSQPEQYYFSVLAYWGLQEHEKIDDVLKNAVQWITQYPDSLWTSRIHLLRVYYHLNQKEYEHAFESMGALFDDNKDLALLALTWGYFKLGETGNLFSILQALDASQDESTYHSQIYRILSRFLIEGGDLRGAVEMDQRERDELQKRMEILKKETEMLRRGISISSLSTPHGSLLADTLLKLQNQVGEKRGVTALYWYIDLQQRQQMLTHLKAREREIDAEQRRLQMEMVRRCLSLQHDDQMKVSTMDQAEIKEITQLYHQARIAAQKGKQLITAERLEKIVRLEPDSAYGIESAFRLGDIFFNQGNYAKAEVFYQRLLSHQDSPLYPLALYKLGWTYHLQGKEKAAILEVIKQTLAQDHPGKNMGPCIMVKTPKERREPWRLLALSLNKLGGPSQLMGLIQAVEPKARYTLVTQVADYYKIENKQDQMFQLIRAWITAYPRYLRTPLLHQKMVNLIKQSSQVSTEAVVAARAEFVNSYQPGSPWAEANFGAKRKRRTEGDPLNPVRPFLKNHLRFLMTHYYGEAKKAETPKQYKKVIPWYQRYLFAFSDELTIGKDRFLYAEILEKLGDYDAAIEAYRESAYHDPSHRLAAEAGYQEILLLEKVYSTLGPEIEAGYDRFSTRFPADRRAEDIAMRLAETAFEQGDFNKSRFYAKQVSLKALSARTAMGGGHMAAHRLVVQGFLKEKAYPEAITFLRDLFSDTNRKEIKKELKPLLVLSYFQEGEHLKRIGAGAQAAVAYWQAYRFGAETEMGPLSLFEAATLWDTPGTLKKAETSLLLFSALYPDSALNHPALIRLAALYQGTHRPLKGAKTYEKVARLPISTELAQKALDQAINLYITAESWEKVYHLAIKGADTEHSHEDRNINPKERGRWMVMAAEATLKMGKNQPALKILSRLVEETEGDEAISPFVAKAHFLLAELKIDRFEAIQLVSPLEENLQKKKTLFEDLLKNYDYAIAHPSPILALNANYRIGEIHEEFSRSLLESERPENLSLEEEELYENLLIEQALPYFEQAEAAYQQNIQMGRAAGMESEWITKNEMHLFMIQQQIDIFMRGGQEVLG